MSLIVKYQIFVSSTYSELKDWRKALIDQILRSDQMPSAMEGFSAADEEELVVIKRAIDQCDIFVVIIGSRFGSAIPGTNPPESFTQREYNYAVAQGKPILAFVLHDEDFSEERLQLSKDDPERACEEDIVRLREQVTKHSVGGDGHRLVEFFRKSEGEHGLSARFTAALKKLLDVRSTQMAGWVRLPRSVGTNPFIRNIVEKLSRFNTLSTRCTEDNPGIKDAMGEHCWYRFAADICNKGICNLFFESGSTVAFVAKRFRERLQEASLGGHKNELRINTNNVLIYLEFTLYEHVRVHLVPHGPPDDNDRYGATFGQLLTREELPHPTKNEALSLADAGSVKVVESTAVAVAPPNAPSLILATASGLELSTHQEFPGPHVGTYRNKLLKRALLMSGHPVILFFDEAKIAPDGPKGSFEVGACHSVCDPEWPWTDAIRKQPLALCIGASSQDRILRVMNRLCGQGPWIGDIPREYEKGWAVVLANQVFHERLGKPAMT